MTAAQIIAFTVGVVITAAGVAAIGGHFMRPGARDRLLLWFGLFAAMYGTRMFFKPPLVSLIGIDQTPAAWVISTFNYVILIPALLFAQELYGPGWRGAFRWITAGFAAYAAAAIVANTIAANPGFSPDPSIAMLALVVVALVVGARAGYKPPPFPEWRLLIASIAVFLLFVVNENAVNRGLLPWRLSPEPIGFLAQLALLGYIAVSRFFSQGRRLAAIDQEMRSARDIQTAILPRELPAAGGIRVAARYLPVAAVAGDFYDVVALDDHSIAVLVADVSGHGVPAALIASMVKVAFMSALADARDPAAILTRMNKTLCGMFARSFVTAACVVVSSSERTVHYALAGHPPPLLVTASNGSVTELSERGIFLGFVPTATYATDVVRLAAGARLVLYTDGVIETPHANDELFGIERLSALAAMQHNGTPDGFADRTLNALREFADDASLAHDDVTLVVVDIDILDAS